MGPVDSRSNYRPTRPTVILMPLQGLRQDHHLRQAGRYLKSKGRRPPAVAADLQRPAAIEPAKKILGEKLDTPVYSETNVLPPDLCARGY